MDAAARDTDSLLNAISGLVSERQSLRSDGATHERLEHNRLEILRLQWEFSYALVRRYLPQAQAA
jgi:hypothetical protein